MKIAIVDVAADTGGALSVLRDCCALLSTGKFCEHEWIILTSTITVMEFENVKCVQFPKIKKSWMHRFIWEYLFSTKWLEKNKIDIVFSLQNKALPTRKIPQVIYFHNLFLLNSKMVHIHGRTFIQNILFYFIIRPLTLNSLVNRKCIIVQTEFMKELLHKYNSQIKTKVISPNIIIDEINQSGSEKLGKTYRGWMYPAPPNEYRQHEIIINAMKYLVEEKKEKINFEIIFTFNGQENKYAKKIAKMCKNLEHIRLVGQMERAEVLKKYQEYGLVITSKYESCPFPIKEAIYYNSPIACLEYDYAKEATQKYKRVYMGKEDPKELAINLLKINKLKNIGSNRGNEISSWVKVLELVLFHGEKSD